MPASKPVALQVGHDGPDELRQRAENEAAMTAPEGIPEEPPERLAGHPAAQAEWHRLVEMYSKIDARIVGSLDVSLLVSYCITEEQCQQLDVMRARVFEQWQETDNTELYNALLRLDARVDRKRAALLQMQERLYMTPRARAAATPESKKPEEPESEMERILRQQPGLF